MKQNRNKTEIKQKQGGANSARDDDADIFQRVAIRHYAVIGWNSWNTETIFDMSNTAETTLKQFSCFCFCFRCVDAETETKQKQFVSVLFLFLLQMCAQL